MFPVGTLANVCGLTLVAVESIILNTLPMPPGPPPAPPRPRLKYTIVPITASVGRRLYGKERQQDTETERQAIRDTRDREIRK